VSGKGGLPRHFYPTSIPKVAKEITDAGLKAGKLTLVSPGVWRSIGGLIYGTVKGTGQSRIEHVSEHLALGFKKDKSGKLLKDKDGNLVPKDKHSIFAIPPDKLLDTLDEAWAKKGLGKKVVQKSGRTAYEIDLGRPIGTSGETKILIVIEKGTTDEIVSAFPITG